MAKFKKGQSGKLAGRPLASGVNVRLRKAIESEADEVIKVMIEQAKAGNSQVAKVLIDKIVPNIKSQPPPIEIANGAIPLETSQSTSCKPLFPDADHRKIKPTICLYYLLDSAYLTS